MTSNKPLPCSAKQAQDGAALFVSERCLWSCGCHQRHCSISVLIGEDGCTFCGCTLKSLASLPAAPREWEHQPCLTAFRLRRNLRLLELHRVSSVASGRRKPLCPQTHRMWLLLNRSFPWNILLVSGNIHTSILT